MADDVSHFGTHLVPFVDRLISSAAFSQLFREGMLLVEESGAYLDGQGRRDAERLNKAAGLAYGTQSMRLTTRLMQLSSWLLLHRAVNAGELSTEQARREKARVNATVFVPSPDPEVVAKLPPKLAALIERSLRLQARIERLEDALGADISVQDNDVGRQMAMLKRAFGR